VAESERKNVVWKKSSLSGSGGGGCVEVAKDAESILVRNSREPAGQVLSFLYGEWEAFLAGVHNHEFELAALLTPPVTPPEVES
jgi:predicted secreted Zn-dependent protease